MLEKLAENSRRFKQYPPCGHSPQAIACDQRLASYQVTYPSPRQFQQMHPNHQGSAAPIAEYPDP